MAPDRTIRDPELVPYRLRDQTLDREGEDGIARLVGGATSTLPIVKPADDLRPASSSSSSIRSRGEVAPRETLRLGGLEDAVGPELPRVAGEGLHPQGQSRHAEAAIGV